MQKITSMHFPETIAQYSGFRQLLLFFDSISLLLPAEDSYQAENPFVKAGQLTQRAPLPFDDDLPNFNRLIKDIQSHGSDFYGSSFSSLSSSTALQVDESSVLNLIAQMKPKDEKGMLETERTGALFQARLLLKLMEIHEFEEAELQEKIHSVSEKKAQLLSALKGDEEMNGLNDGPDMEIGSEPPLRFKQRLKAWASLLLADKNQPPWLATTGPNDAFDLLKESISSQTKPIHLFTLSLARKISGTEGDEQYSTFLCDFQNKTRACREGLFSHLERTGKTGTFQEDEHFIETINLWEKSIQSLPAHETKKIEFYLFKMPFSKLLAEGSGLKNIAPRDSSRQNSILGVLK